MGLSYFTPNVSADGIISWTNNGSMQNPTSVSIRGPQGEAGKGIPIGGWAGQILMKNSNTDYDAEWMDGATMIAATLSVASWIGNAAPYTYTLTLVGVTADNTVEMLPSAEITATQLEALQGANIQDGGQSANQIILKAFGDKPSVDLPVRFIVRRGL